MTTNARRTRDPRDIEAELDRTRARMSDTLNLLESKISLGALFDQAWNYARAKGDRQMSSNVKDIIARNPLPVTLVGVALAWLMMSGRRGSVGSNRALSGQQDDSAGMSEDLQAGPSSPTGNMTFDDQLAADVDEASTGSDKPGLTVYGGGRSDVAGSEDEVAEGLDEASPTRKKTGAGLEGGSSSTPSGSAAEGLAGASTDTRATHVTLDTRNDKP